MAIEIVDLPIKNGGSFHGYVKLPEGTPTEQLHFFWNMMSSTTRMVLNGEK